jgi:hypothetical protein
MARYPYLEMGCSCEQCGLLSLIVFFVFLEAVSERSTSQSYDKRRNEIGHEVKWLFILRRPVTSEVSGEPLRWPATTLQSSARSIASNASGRELILRLLMSGDSG